MKMKPGYKFFSFTSVAALLSCSLCEFVQCNAFDSTNSPQVISRTIAIFTVLGALAKECHGLPPSSLFQRRLGSPMPQLGGPPTSTEDDDSEEEEDLLESSPRVEPQITPLNRDQCLAKLLCGMSVPVTGGNSKKNYYSEYANIVSKFFEAFPYDDELQSKESIETYDDYSNEDDGKPTRFNSKRKPMNSSRVQATQPTLQLFDLALVDVARPEDLRNRTRKAVLQKVSFRRNSKFWTFPINHRVARARKIVENLGQKLQTVRQCQSIAGCPFSFKQLREKLKQKEAQRISSNVALPPLPGPIFPSSLRKKQEPTLTPFIPKPYVKPQSRPKPIPPTPKPEAVSMELFSSEQRPSSLSSSYPHKDNNKGDDELEEFFGPPKIQKRPLGFHQGVDSHYNYDYNPDRPWRPGMTGDNNYGHRPWKNNNNQSRPPPRPHGGSGNVNGGERPPQRLPPRPRPLRPNNNNNAPPNRAPGIIQKKQRPSLPPVKTQQSAIPRPPPKKPVAQSDTRPRPPAVQHSATTTKSPSPFPKKKISYLNSPYKKPVSNEDDDEGSEDINKVAPLELVGNSDAGEGEPTRKTTTSSPVFQTTAAPTTKKSKKNNDDSDSEEDYEDDDYYEDNYEEEDLDDDYSEEEETSKKKKKKKVYSTKKKNKKKEESEEDEEEEEEDDKEEVTTKASTTTSTTTSLKPRIKIHTSSHFDDETDDVDAIWMKLNYATTGGQHEGVAKKKKEGEEETKPESKETKPTSVEEDSEEDDEEEEEEEDDGNGNDSALGTLQKVRTSSVSGSVEDETDDELDEENRSKKSSRKKSKTKVKGEGKDDGVAQDIQGGNEKANKSDSKKSKKSKKQKKGSKKPGKKGSDEEEGEESRDRMKNIMMEIGGRPLVPKPEKEQTSNAQKTTSLLSNRFKFQFINPYGAPPPAPHHQNVDGPPPSNAFGHPMPSSFKPSFTPTSSAPSHSSSGSGGGMGSASSLPFNYNINSGGVGNHGGGPGHGGAMPGFGGASSASGSLEMPDPHHPPPSTPFMPHNNPHNQLRQDPHHQGPMHMPMPMPMPSGGGAPGGLGASALSGASSLFKMNPLSSLKKLFKRPGSGSGFDPMNPHHDGHGPPPPNAFMHRPIGPESSQFKRERTPASGSSSPKKGTKGSKSGKSKGKGKNETI